MKAILNLLFVLHPALAYNVAWWQGSLFVADTFNHVIRLVALSSGEVHVATIAGGRAAGHVNGEGIDARFDRPRGIAAWDRREGSPRGITLYVADEHNNAVRCARQVEDGSFVVTTLAGGIGPGASDGVGDSASFYHPTAVAATEGMLFVADTFNNAIRSIDLETHQVSTLLDGGGAGRGRGHEGLLNQPGGLQLDGDVLLVSDTGNHRVILLPLRAGGTEPTVGASSRAGDVRELAWAPGAAGAAAAQMGAATAFRRPQDVALAAAGPGAGSLLYVSDYDGHRITALALDSERRIVTAEVLAGTGAPGLIDGEAATARFAYPRGLALDERAMLLYVTDSSNHAVRRVDLTAAPRTVTTTVVGGRGCGRCDGSRAAARFHLSNPHEVGCEDACPETSTAVPSHSHSEHKPSGCRDWCEHRSCCELTGDVVEECSGCTSTARCQPGARCYLGDPALALCPKRCDGSSVPFIIHGTSRSGTSWLQSLLANSGDLYLPPSGLDWDDNSLGLSADFARGSISETAVGCSRFELGAVVESRPPQGFATEIFRHMNPNYTGKRHLWTAYEQVILHFWRQCARAAPRAAAIGFSWNFGHDWQDYYWREYRAFARRVGVQMVLVVRKSCLEHFISFEHRHMAHMAEIGDNTEKGHTEIKKKMKNVRALVIDTARLRKWCEERNEQYDEARQRLYNVHVLSYEGLRRDAAAELVAVRAMLSLPPSGKPPKSRLLKLHTGGAYRYVANHEEVRAFAPERFDYDY